MQAFALLNSCLQATYSCPVIRVGCVFDFSSTISRFPFQRCCYSAVENYILFLDQGSSLTGVRVLSMYNLHDEPKVRKTICWSD